MKKYLRNWDFVRGLRLAFGVFIVIQGVIANEWILAALGGLFSLMPLMNISCCCASSCTTTASHSKKKEDISYEEIS